MNQEKDYFSIVYDYLDKVKRSQRDNIMQATKIMGDCMRRNGIIQLYGVGHSRAFSMELGYRAGGLMPYHQMFERDLVLRGYVTKEETLAPEFLNRTDLVDMFLDTYNVVDEDMFLLVSGEEVHASTLAFAKKVKEKGHQLIVVINMSAVSSTTDGKTLCGYADLVIDTCAPYPDEVVNVDADTNICQVTGIGGNMIAQMITAEIYHYLCDLGEKPPVLLSANITGADVHNRAISDKYVDRWNS